MKVQVLQLGEADLDDLVELEHICFGHHWSKDQFLVGIEQGTYIVLGIREDRQLVAYITFSLVEDEMEILNLAVHPDSRKRKLASALMERAVAVCIERGVRLSFLEVRASNAPAISLYRKYGYEQYGIRRKYYPDNKEDALLFRREMIRATSKGL